MDQSHIKKERKKETFLSPIRNMKVLPLERIKVMSLFLTTFARVPERINGKTKGTEKVKCVAQLV